MEAIIEKKHTFAVMDKTGDTKTIWDPRNPDEVEAAEDQFKKLKGKGYLIYRVEGDGSKGTAMTKFDPKAEKMIAVPPVTGG